MLTRNDPKVMQLAAEAGCDPRTVLRALSGEPLRQLVRDRVERAAKKLGIRLPTEGKRGG